RVDVGVAVEIFSFDVQDAQVGGVDGSAFLGLDVDRRSAGLVEGQLQVVATQQVDTVERSVIGELVELVAQFVELIGQVGANRVAIDLGSIRRDAINGSRGRNAVNIQFLRGLVFDAQLAVVVRSANLALEIGIIVDLGDERVDALGGGSNFGNAVGGRGGSGSDTGSGRNRRVAGLDREVGTVCNRDRDTVGVDSCRAAGGRVE